MSKDRAALAAEHPDTWIPLNAGDEIQGQIVDATSAWSDQIGDNGDFYPLLTIDMGNGETKKVHCFSTVIFNEVMSKQPQVGENVRFVYEGEGEVKVKGRNAPKLYRLYIEGRTDQAQRVYDAIGKNRRMGAGAQALAERQAAAQATDGESDTADVPF